MTFGSTWLICISHVTMLAALRLVQLFTWWGVFAPPARHALRRWSATIVLPVSGATRCRISPTQPPDFRAAPSGFNNEYLLNFQRLTTSAIESSLHEPLNFQQIYNYELIQNSQKSNWKYYNHDELNRQLKLNSKWQIIEQKIYLL